MHSMRLLAALSADPSTYARRLITVEADTTVGSTASWAHPKSGPLLDVTLGVQGVADPGLHQTHAFTRPCSRTRFSIVAKESSGPRRGLGVRQKQLSSAPLTMASPEPYHGLPIPHPQSDVSCWMLVRASIPGRRVSPGTRKDALLSPKRPTNKAHTSNFAHSSGYHSNCGAPTGYAQRITLATECCLVTWRALTQHQKKKGCR